MNSAVARLQFVALFTDRQPTREEMFMRDDFRILAATVGMNLGECYDALTKHASKPKFNGNLILAAEDWYAQASMSRF